MVKIINGRINDVVLSTREVLTEHLRVKLSYVTPVLSNDAVRLLTNQSTNNDILKFLQDSKSLQDKICQVLDTIKYKKVKNDDVTKEVIGEKLFLKVAEIDSELCAQITGMLLELDLTSIQELLDNPDKLRSSVFQAKSEYLKYTLGEESHTEKIGEKIFSIVAAFYPKEASKITGMLLELDSSELLALLGDTNELHRRIQQAYSVLK